MCEKMAVFDNKRYQELHPKTQKAKDNKPKQEKKKEEKPKAEATGINMLCMWLNPRTLFWHRGDSNIGKW